MSQDLRKNHRERLLLSPTLPAVLVLTQYGIGEAEPQRVGRNVIADEEGIGLRQQIVEIEPLDLDTDRTVRVWCPFRSLQLDMDPDIGCTLAIDDLDLTVSPIVLSIRSLQDKVAGIR
ncbi:hypothetical protein D3C87_1686840 [compost metagenome]